GGGRGEERTDAGDLVWWEVGVRERAGPWAPTCGAAADAGMRRPPINIENTKRPSIKTLKPARMEPTNFPRYCSGRRNARRMPIARRPAAKAKSSRLAHGKLRVQGNCTKKEK